MKLCFGHRPHPFTLDSTRHYLPEELECKAFRLFENNQIITLQIENEYIPVVTHEEVSFACKIASSYHNQISSNVPQDDGWNTETAEMESLAVKHMTDPLSDQSGTECEADT